MNNEQLECKECGFKSRNLHMHVKKKHMPIDDYCAKYNCTRGSLTLSKPPQSSNTKEYWLKQGLTEEEALAKQKEEQVRRSRLGPINNPNLYKEMGEKRSGDSNNMSRINVAKRHNCSLEEAIQYMPHYQNGPMVGRKHTPEAIKKIQQASKEQVILNGGKPTNWQWQQSEEGIKCCHDRVKNSLNKFGKLHYSGKEKEFAEWIKEHLSSSIALEFNKSIGRYIVDILIDNRVVLEFQGDYWHCNPLVYNDDYYHKIIGKTAKEIRERDRVRKEEIESSGYKVFVVWESQFHKAKEEIKEILKEIE